MLPNRATAALVLSLASVAGAAGTLAPPSRPEEVVGTATLTKPPANAIRMGGLVIEFEKTGLDVIRSRAGVGSIGHTGDASGSEYFLCFIADDGLIAHRLWLISHGEMGGPDHDVTEVIAERIEGTPTVSADCPRLPPSMLPVALDRGIWIGMRRDTLRAKLGSPSASRSNWLHFNYLASDPRGHWDVTSTLEVRIVDGRIDALRFTKVTSN